MQTAHGGRSTTFYVETIQKQAQQHLPPTFCWIFAAVLGHSTVCLKKHSRHF